MPYAPDLNRFRPRHAMRTGGVTVMLAISNRVPSVPNRTPTVREGEAFFQNIGVPAESRSTPSPNPPRHSGVEKDLVFRQSSFHKDRECPRGARTCDKAQAAKIGRALQGIVSVAPWIACGSAPSMSILMKDGRGPSSRSSSLRVSIDVVPAPPVMREPAVPVTLNETVSFRLLTP